MFYDDTKGEWKNFKSHDSLDETAKNLSKRNMMVEVSVVEWIRTFYLNSKWSIGHDFNFQLVLLKSL